MLTREDILALHNDALQNYSGSYGFNDEQLEEIIVKATKIEAITDIYETCAYLMQSLILIKPFNSFNKKVAVQCVGGLLSFKKIDFTLSSLEANNLVASIDLNEITAQHIIKILKENSISHAP